MSFDDDTSARLEVDAKEIIAPLPAGRGRRCCRCCTSCSPRRATSARTASSSAPTQLDLTTAEVAAVATFYTMYKRRPNGEYPVGVCTNTLCAVMGGDQIFADAQGPPRHRPRRDHRGRQGHPRAHRVQRRLRLRAGRDGQLGVLRQPDARVGHRARRRPARRRRCRRPPAAPSLCTFKQVSRVLAGFHDGRADEGPAAGPATLAGLQICSARASSAAAADAAPATSDGRATADGACTPHAGAHRTWDRTELLDRCDVYERHDGYAGAAQPRWRMDARRGHPDRSRTPGCAAAAAPASRPA